jgi:hypothetical protein
MRADLVEIAPAPVLIGLGRGNDGVAGGHSVGAGMPRRRRVTATNVVTREAATQMHPTPADRKAIAASGCEVAGKWGQRSGIEMCTIGHARSFPRVLVCALLQRGCSIGPLVRSCKA